MEVRFYQSGCADAASISFQDENGKPYHIFLDAGFERTFRQVLSEEIEHIVSRGEKINLWVVTHIHDDHIGGVIGYINAVETKLFPDIVERWWYNAPRQSLINKNITPSLTSRPSSIRQGDQLAAYLNGYTDWDQLSILSRKEPYEIGDLKITVLSPSAKGLKMLKEKYKYPACLLEQSEGERISEAMGATGRDHHFKIEELLRADFKEDNNIENGSCIAMITDYRGFKILWLSDAHPSTVMNSLIELGYSQTNPIICDWVKVSHHGSAANNSTDLYRFIQCSNFLISVNGDNIHGLPNKAAIVNILKSRSQPDIQQYNFHFTHDDPILRSIFLSDGADVFERFNFSVYFQGKENHICIST